MSISLHLFLERHFRLHSSIFDICRKVCVVRSTVTFRVSQPGVICESPLPPAHCDHALTLPRLSYFASARKLSSRMQPLSFVLLARNIPFKRSSLGPGDDGAGGCAEEAGGSERCCTIRNVEGEAGAVALSLRHEVCHRLLRRRFLQGTPYEEEVRQGFSSNLLLFVVVPCSTYALHMLSYGVGCDQTTCALRVSSRG